MKKHQTYRPALDSLESRHVLSAMSAAAAARAQALMEIQVRNQQQAEIRAERLAAQQARIAIMEQAHAARTHVFAAVQPSTAASISVSPSRARFMPFASNTGSSIPTTVNVNGAFRPPIMAARASLLNAPGFVAPSRILIRPAFFGGTVRINVSRVARVSTGATALVGNLRVPISTLLATPTTTTTTTTTTANTGTFATGSTVTFRNGLPVTTSSNTANTFANTSLTIQMPNGFPTTLGLTTNNTLAQISPTIQFNNGFPTTTGFTPVVTSATTTAVMQTSNGLTVSG